MVTDYAFALPWLDRQDIRKFAWLLKDQHYHNFHTSYAIDWMQWLMDYYDYTGDKSLVVELAPYLHAVLDKYETWRGTNGLVSEAPDYMFMDWVTIGGFPCPHPAVIGQKVNAQKQTEIQFQCHHPPAVIGQGYLTADYYHGLDLGSRVAELMGDTARVQKYAAIRGDIAAAFNRELWVADKGLYRDGKPFVTHVKPGPWLPADRDVETFSPHVNALAVLYNLAPREQQARIIEKVMAEQPLDTQPWFMHRVFAAIDHVGLFNSYGTSQLRRWHVISETQTFHEMWDGGDRSHGWCSTPLTQMSGRILGVTPTTPAFKTLAIRPQICDLTWARGIVPTPHGDVAVSWSWASDRLHLSISIPEGTEADLVLPDQTVHMKAGQHELDAAYQRPASVANGLPTDPEDMDADLAKDNLLRDDLASAEDHCGNTGGGTNADALFNGTTHNGSGGTDTLDDGKTFRGYGHGDWLTIHLKEPCDITQIRTFAGHSDARASQSYTVFAAYAGDPTQFVKIASGSKASDGGASELRVAVNANRVVAVRLEFEDGPIGFNAYREINIVGHRAK